jgi:hypothetical protein
MSAPSGGRGLMTSWQCSLRSISRLGTPDGITRSTRPGAPGAGAHQGGQQQVALEVVGGDGEGGLPARRVELARARKALQLAQQLARLRRQRLGPRGGTMPRPDFTNSGSPVMARSLSSRWLTADCVTPRRCAHP